MNTAKKKEKSRVTVAKVARSVSFNSERLSDKKQISRDRKRYIKSVSAKALTSVNA